MTTVRPHFLPWHLFVCILLSLCCALPAPAAPRDPGKTAADDAALAFKEGRFQDAAEGFEKAFALGPDKIVRMRNAGRAWEEAGKLEYARTKFQRYLDKAPPGAEREEVVERLAKLEARMAAEKAADTPVQAAEPEPAQPTPPPAPPQASPAVAAAADVATAPATPAPASGRGRQITGWSLVGTGAALAAGGVAWLVMTESQARVVENGVAGHLYSTDTLAEADRAAIRQHRVGAIVLGAVGVAAGVVGAVVLATAPPAVASSRPRALPVAAVSPWASRDGAGLVLSGRF